MRKYNEIKIESVDCGNVLENPDVCRVCLNGNTKMYNLFSSHFSETFSAVTGLPITSTDGLPQHICILCVTLLQKMFSFRNRCHETHTMLVDNLLKNNAIQMSDIVQDYKQLKTVLLATTKILNIDCTPSTETKTRKNTPKIDVYEIKKEEDKNFDQADAFYVNDFLDIDDTDIPDPEIKEEKDDNTDTEPEYTRTKKKKNVKKKEGKKKIKKEKTEDIDTEMEYKEEIEKPKKRLYNRKSEEDFVAFAKTYNVEVIFLTKEQMINEVQSRKELEGYITSRFQCTQCYRSFMKESAYNKHMDTHAPSAGSHECDVCHIRFPVRHKLMKHVRRHRMQFICKFCNQVTKDSTLAKMHYKWHEGFKYDCKHCGKKFSKPSSYMNHVREQHSPAACAACPQLLPGTRALDRHVATAHAQTYKCDQCGIHFQNEAALLRHTEIFTGRVCEPCLRPCQECGENFNTLDHLNSHLEKDHNNKIYRCEICNTTYVSDRQLGIHWTRSHRGQQRGEARGRGDGDYMCEVCAKSYPSETTLRYHQRIHTGERPFQCPMCPKRFRLKTNLQVHMNTHTGARPFKCALCPETFKSYSQKHKHRLLVHTKERRHKCHMCDKTYVVSFDLKMHIRTAHMKVPLPARARSRKRPNIDCHS